MTSPNVAGGTDFVDLLRREDGRLRAFAFRLVADDVDDVLQTAYLAAFRSLSTFRGESSLSTWLHRIVYTTALNHRRSRRVGVLASNDGRGEPARDVEDLAVQRMDVARALHGLSLEQRAVLLLVDGDGFSYDDAALVLGVPTGTVRSRLSRARAAMRQAFPEQEVD